MQEVKPELREILVMTLRWTVLAKGDVTPLLVAEDYARVFDDLESSSDDGGEGDKDTGSQDGFDTDDESKDSKHSGSGDWNDVSDGENESEGSEYKESENGVEATEGERVVTAADLGNLTSNDETPDDHTADSETSDDDREMLDDTLRHVKEAGSAFVESVPRDVPLRLRHASVKDFVLREGERSNLTRCKTFCPRCARIEGETSLLSLTPKHGHLAISLTICEFNASSSPGSMILSDWISQSIDKPGFSFRQPCFQLTI